MQKQIRSMMLGLALVIGAAGVSVKAENTVVSPHSGDLVVLHEDKLVPAPADQFFKAPVTILYYSAGWCPDCRKFSPKLVSAYNAQAGGKKFEVLLISRDKTEEGMLKYMKAEKMPWPALAFQKVAGAEDLKKFYSGKGIPCLTVIDAGGKILKQSQSDQDAADILASLKTNQ